MSENTKKYRKILYSKFVFQFNGHNARTRTYEETAKRKYANLSAQVIFFVLFVCGNCWCPEKKHNK